MHISACRIAALWHGHVARKKMRCYYVAALHIQFAWEWFLARRTQHFAALRIQRAWHEMLRAWYPSFMARLQRYEKLFPKKAIDRLPGCEKYGAACHIATLWRGHVVRKEMRRKQRAAWRIQLAWHEKRPDIVTCGNMDSHHSAACTGEATRCSPPTTATAKSQIDRAAELLGDRMLSLQVIPASDDDADKGETIRWFPPMTVPDRRAMLCAPSCGPPPPSPPAKGRRYQFHHASAGRLTKPRGNTDRKMTGSPRQT